MRAEPHQVSVLVADDHGPYRRGLVELLRDRGLHVAGEAADGDEAVALAASEAPDVVLMDLAMPRLSGVEATRRIVAGDPSARVLALTVLSSDEALLDALAAGASGYLLKSEPPEALLDAVRATARGETALSPEVARRLVERLRDERRPAAASGAQLSQRELEVLRLVAAGKQNAEIAELLGISPLTAKNHVASVLAKLGVDNRVQAAVHAVRRGLV